MQPEALRRWTLASGANRLAGQTDAEPLLVQVFGGPARSATLTIDGDTALAFGDRLRKSRSVTSDEACPLA